MPRRIFVGNKTGDLLSEEKFSRLTATLLKSPEFPTFSSIPVKNSSRQAVKI